MAEQNGSTRKGPGRGAVLKILALLLFIVAAVYSVQFTQLREYFTQETLGAFLEDIGWWAPAVFSLLYAIGVCLFVPGTLLAGVGAALFGPYVGFVFVWIGAMLGASTAFFIGRTLGREFAASLVGDRLKKYDEAIESNGFATVLYLRLIYFPFTPMNFGMGLTRVRFWDYFFGTAFGIVVGTFIFTFFIGTLRDVWLSGEWSGLLSWQVFLSVALFAFSLYLPRLVKKIRGENEAQE